MPADPYATLPAGELERTTAPLAWIVEGLFLEAGAGILGGAPKTGKSFLALDLCVAIASGTSCASSFRVLAPGPVVLLCAEDPQAVVSSRLTALARARERALNDLPIEVIVDAVRLPEGLDRLEATLAATRPRLLLLDPLIRLHRADENSASEMSFILDGLRNLARSSRTAILLVHHARKAVAGNAGAGLRGSSDLAAFGDTNLYLRRLSQDAALELKIEHRAAAAPAPLRLKLVVDDGAMPSARFDAIDREQQEDPTVGRVLHLLASSTEPLSSAALREKLGVRNQLVADALRGLADAGRIRRAGRDGWVASQTAP
jgi:AAA domain